MAEYNAQIKSTALGIEDHGILTAFLMLEFSGGGQAFGGYAFDTPIKDDDGKFLRREGTAYGMEFVRRILETVGARDWEDLKGKYCRIRKEGEWSSTIESIGHITKDKWFTPRKDLAHLKEVAA